MTKTERKAYELQVLQEHLDIVVRDQFGGDLEAFKRHLRAQIDEILREDAEKRRARGAVR